MSVRCTGHNICGYAVCDDGIVIDLSGMKAITVDAAARTVRVEAGCTWGEVNDALQPYELAATGGFVSVTGVSGLTLGGGLGWLVRKHGLALDNLLSAEIVLADGQMVTASDSEHDDLFWAIRGGGGNFGIVTTFEFRAHPVGTVLAGMVFHPAADAGRRLAPVARASKRARQKRAHRARCCSTSQMIHPDRLRSWARRSWESAASTLVRSRRARESFGRCAATARRWSTRSNRCRTTRPSEWPTFSGRPDSMATGSRAYLDQLERRGDRHHRRLLRPGAVHEDGRRARAQRRWRDGSRAGVPRRHSDIAVMSYNLLITSAWLDAKDTERNIAWTREFFAALQPFMSNAAYVNYLGGDEGPAGLTGGLWCRQAWTSRGVENEIRPGQSVPHEPEHCTGTSVSVRCGTRPTDAAH